MWNLKAVMTSLLLTVLLIGTVNGLPIPSNLPTEIIPLGISAPFTCPAETVGEGSGEGSAEESEPCTNLDNELKEVMESAIRPIVSESVMEQMENSFAFVVDFINDEFTSGVDDIDSIIVSMPNLLDTVFELYVPTITVADSSDVSTALTSAVIEYIEGGSYSCKISIENIASAVSSYLGSTELQSLTETEIADKSSSVNEILGTLIADSPATSVLPAIQTQFIGIVSFIVNSGAYNPVIALPILEFVSGPVSELPSDSEVLAAIVAQNSLPDELTEETPEVETTVISEVIELIECTICSISKNAVDEVIVKAVTDLLTSADTTGATDADSIATSVSQSVSAGVLGNAFFDSVLAGISQRSLGLTVLETIIERLSTTDSRNIIDITSAESVLRSVIDTDELEEKISNCVENYLADPEAIETAITNAATNAIVTDQVSPNTVASISIDDIIQELVPSINDTMNSFDGSSIIPILKNEISEILSTAFYDPAVLNLVTQLNKDYFTAIIKKFMSSENLVNTNLQAFGGFPKEVLGTKKNGLPNLFNTFLNLLMKYSDKISKKTKVNQMAIQDDSDKTIAPLNNNNKKILSLKPIFKKSIKMIGKMIKRFFPGVTASNLEIQSKKRAKRAILSKQVKTMKKVFGTLNEAASSLGDQFSEVGYWLLKFPPVVNAYNGVREISLESIRKDTIDFLAGFDFIERQDLEEFSVDGVIDNMSVSSFVGDSTIDYLSSWEEYIDGLAIDAGNEMNKFGKRVDDFKKSTFPFNLFFSKD